MENISNLPCQQDENLASVENNSYEETDEELSETEWIGETPGGALLTLAYNGEIGKIPALLKAGCRIDAEDLSGETVLHVLAQVVPMSQHLEADRIMRELMREDSDMNSYSKIIRKAHGIAALKCMPEVLSVVEAVIQAGADVNKVDFDRETPLTLAAKGGYFFLIPTIVTNTKCKVMHTNRWGRQALDYLAGFNGAGDSIHPSSRDPEITIAAIEAIIHEGGDVDKPTRSGVTPFEMVLNHSKSELFIPLIKYSVKTNEKIIDVMITERRFPAVKLMVMAGWEFSVISAKVKVLSRDSLIREQARSSLELLQKNQRENNFCKEREDAFLSLKKMLMSPLPLRHQARIAIRRYVGVRKLRELSLPRVMLDYITLKYD